MKTFKATDINLKKKDFRESVQGGGVIIEWTKNRKTMGRAVAIPEIEYKRLKKNDTETGG